MGSQLCEQRDVKVTVLLEYFASDACSIGQKLYVIELVWCYEHLSTHVHLAML